VSGCLGRRWRAGFVRLCLQTVLLKCQGLLVQCHLIQFMPGIASFDWLQGGHT
jgi:hypothetical protein